MGILRSLDTKKAIGHDKLPTIVLKECADSLAPSIMAIINFSLNKGFQLSDWKKASIPPIFKRGKRECVENYRPVSLLPVISKVQERCVASRLVPHVKGKGKGTHYLTSEVPLLSREYSPRKPTVRSFYPPLSISALF